jgi:hypothetical protein
MVLTAFIDLQMVGEDCLGPVKTSWLPGYNTHQAQLWMQTGAYLPRASC